MRNKTFYSVCTVPFDKKIFLKFVTCINTHNFTVFVICRCLDCLGMRFKTRFCKDFDPMVMLLLTDESFLNWFYFNTPILDNIIMT